MKFNYTGSLVLNKLWLYNKTFSLEASFKAWIFFK